MHEPIAYITQLRSIDLLRSVILGLAIHVCLASSLSISSGAKNSLTSGQTTNQDKIQDGQSQQEQQQQQNNPPSPVLVGSSSDLQMNHQTTALPSVLITTSSQYNFLEAIPPKLRHQTQSSSYKSVNLSSLEYSRSSSDAEADDSLPLATVNNHSGSNLNLAQISKPSQYVDVSALVGVSDVYNRKY